MAEGERPPELISQQTNLVARPTVVTLAGNYVSENGEINADILQQALEEASQSIGETTVQYAEDVVIADAPVHTDSVDVVDTVAGPVTVTDGGVTVTNDSLTCEGAPACVSLPLQNMTNTIFTDGSDQVVSHLGNQIMTVPGTLTNDNDNTQIITVETGDNQNVNNLHFQQLQNVNDMQAYQIEQQAPQSDNVTKNIYVTADGTIIDSELVEGVGQQGGETFEIQGQQVILADQSQIDPAQFGFYLQDGQNLEDGQNIVLTQNAQGETQQIVLTETPSGELQQVVLAQPAENMKTENVSQTRNEQIVLTETPQGNTKQVVLAQVPDGHQTIILQQPEPVVNVPPEPKQLHVVQEVAVPSDPNNPQAGCTVVMPNKSTPTDAPLGSSQNPIRIVQQGNQYTSLQQLTQEQLSQIMQVVQEQQVAKAANGTSGSSVLFNPVTNTRIVYRVIYPSELHGTKKIAPALGRPKQTAIQVKVPSRSASSGPVGLQKRQYKKRRRHGEIDENADDPEISKEEKEHRKKQRPRTRSGRVSRPPKRMVQDYKHIHPLDYDEEYDDSDGGYSDYRVSDEEAARRKGDSDNSSYMMLGSTKPKKWKCNSCDKCYIGRAGLGRHYRLNPTHGALEGDLSLFPDADDESSNQSEQLASASTSLTFTGQLPDSVTEVLSKPSTSSGIESVAEQLSVDLAKQEDISIDNAHTSQPEDVTPSSPAITSTAMSAMTTASPTVTTCTTTSVIATTCSTRTSTTSACSVTTSSKTAISSSNGILKTSSAKPAHISVQSGTSAKQISAKMNASLRRKNRLKELLQQCSEEEVMEVVLPRLAHSVTLWEFLLMRVEKGKPSRPHCTDILREYDQLRKHVRGICKKCLKLTSSKSDGENFEIACTAGTKVQISDPSLARSLDMEIGYYTVEDDSFYKEPEFQYKLLVSNRQETFGENPPSKKRKLEIVPPDQLRMPSKRVRIHMAPPDQSPPHDMTNGFTSISPPLRSSKGVLPKLHKSSPKKSESSSFGMHFTPKTASTPFNKPTVKFVTVSKPNENGTGISQKSVPNHHIVQIVSADVQDKSKQKSQFNEQQLPTTDSLQWSVCNGEKKLCSEPMNELISDTNRPECMAATTDAKPDCIVKSTVITTPDSAVQPVYTTGQDCVAASTICSTDSDYIIPTLYTSAVVSDDQIKTVESTSPQNTVSISLSSSLTSPIKCTESLPPSPIMQNPDILKEEETPCTIVGAQISPVKIIMADPLEEEDKVKEAGEVQVQPLATIHFPAGDPAEIMAPDVPHVQDVIEVAKDEETIEEQVFIQNEALIDGQQHLQIQEGSQIYQTEDGLLLIQNPDGTVHVHGQTDEPVPLETLQAIIGGMGDTTQIITETVVP